jgi:hypothetical protein
MPRAPMFPIMDWKTVFNAGLTFLDWLAAAENPEKRVRMESIFEEQRLEPHQAAFLSALPRAVHVVAIAEDWCGDVVRHAPVLARLTREAPNLQVSFVRRDQEPGVFERFLTNGGEAIPKFVFLSDDFVECGNWGPMVAEGRRLISRGKACGDVAAARTKVSALYEADADRLEVLRELIDCIEVAACTTP